MKKYGYARISTAKQSIDRQIQNIKEAAPDAVILTETYTGTKIDRPVWNRLMKTVKAGDVIIFDEVSRMSRDADEGFQVYQDLMNKGVDLQFIKEPHINTSVYAQALDHQLKIEIQTGKASTDNLISGMADLLNRFMLDLAKEQIRLAFDQAQAEVDHLHKRTSEGVRRAQAEGKQVGRAAGAKVETKKSKEMKERIRQMSRDFDGCMIDSEVIAVLGIARNTYYKYKGQIKETQK